MKTDNTDITTCMVCGVGGMDVKLSNNEMCTSCEQKVNDTVHLLNANVSSSNNADDVVSCLDRLKLSNEDISDDKLFADPPKQECPICMLPMLFASRNSIDMFCCGKSICVGCVGKAKDEIRKGNMKDWCPLCRVPTIRSNDVSYLKKRTDVNDPEACHRLGISYSNGQDGLRQDRKAFELFYRGAEFGSIRAHYNLACAYMIGEGGERDVKKAVYHMKLAAIGGHEGARYSLGLLEKGDINLRMKHFMIAAKSGYDTALKAVGEGYKAGHVTKDDYAKTLRTYQVSVDEMKSEQRSQYCISRV